MDQTTDAIVVPLAPPKLQVSRVRYQFPGQLRDALAEVSFTLRQGGAIAVVGPAKSGKSTLLRLLRGQLEPTSGSILLDGVAGWQEKPMLRCRIALVPTDGALLAGSVGHNIALDQPQAPSVEVMAAARAAGLEELIEQMPERYATQLGATGYPLTVGQRRRILLARALLTRPDVLLLDEPTAGLYAAERHALIGELCGLAVTYTTVLATGDSLVVALADQVVRLAPVRVASG